MSAFAWSRVCPPLIPHRTASSFLLSSQVVVMPNSTFLSYTGDFSLINLSLFVLTIPLCAVLTLKHSITSPFTYKSIYQPDYVNPATSSTLNLWPFVWSSACSLRPFESLYINHVTLSTFSLWPFDIHNGIVLLYSVFSCHLHMPFTSVVLSLPDKERGFLYRL